MVLFSEKQKFQQWWLWVIFLLPFVFEVFKKYNGSHPISLTLQSWSFYVYIPFLILLLLFSVMSLNSEINEEGIKIQFLPFHLKARFYPWKSILSVYIRKYKPLREYGGWGIRYSLTNSGTAYNVSGNIGIQLVLKDGKKILIGTRKSVEVNEILRQIGKVDQEKDF